VVLPPPQLPAANALHDEMSEDKAVAPLVFRGTAVEKGEDGYRHFANYCAYREMAPE